MVLTRATPLAGIDAVVMDTETTGLDIRKARVVEIGAVRIAEGHIREDSIFATLVDPGEPIASASVAFHGIDTARVRGAPGFADAYARFRSFAGDTILVGHSIGFDLAILAEECRAAGVIFAPTPTLDTAHLAAVAAPELPGTSMETLAAWLGIEVTGRHTAPGDALTTARIFVRLVPHLRRRGIRTYGEAEAACRAVSAALMAAGHAPPPAGTAAGDDRPLGRIDPFPFRHLNRDVMSSPPRTIPRGRSLGEAIRVMSEGRVSSLFVTTAEDPRPNGIVTERDVMRAVAAKGGNALDVPVGEVASAPLITVGADDYVYRAIGRMDTHRIRHLAVIDDDGTVVGALSARDLLRLRSGEALSLGDAIDAADSANALAAAWGRLPAVATALLAEGVGAREIAAVISSEICAMTRRAGALAERRLAEVGEGAPPVPYALLVLGSAGRGESLLAPDQDNAVIYADSDDGDRAEHWFAAFGRMVADLLDEAGIPYCKGGIMAANADWRGSVGGWRRRIGEWIGRSNPRDLLNVDVFFDLVPVHGDPVMGETIWRDGYAAAEGNAAFAKLLAEADSGFRPPVTIFGRFRTEDGRIDLKKGGLFPIVSSARLLSIRYSVLARSTPDRLKGIRALDIGGGDDLDRLVDIQGLLVDLLLRQQIEDISDGVPPTNRIPPRRLPRTRQAELLDALKALKSLPPMVKDLLFTEREIDQL